MEIILNYSYAFKWKKDKNIYFKGYFYFDDIYYEEEKAAQFLSEIKNLKEILQKINGVFTIIKAENNEVIVISDITRSFPIFYSKINNNWIISDEIEVLKSKIKNPKFLNNSENEFLASNHVHGKKTLLENVFQTQSSEYIHLNSTKVVEQFFYFSYSIAISNIKKQNNVKENCKNAIENAFERTIKSIEDKQIVVPLSSGYDSRLITVFLKKYNIKNVLCYTYGSQNSYEIKHSKKVAETLNFKWIFIEYDEKISTDYLNDYNFKQYVKYAGKHVAMPNLQEYFAVKYLTENNLIEKEAVFIPGYAGDILGGSEYKYFKNKKISKDNIHQILFKSKMINKSFTFKERKNIITEIQDNLFLLDKNFKNKIPETVFDDYNLKERITKFIFNSASFYSFFGYEFRFPFWDLEILNFFKNLDPVLKKDKLFFDAILEEYFINFDVFFKKEDSLILENKHLKKLKKSIKPILSRFIKKKRLQKIDWNNYQLLTKKMLLEMKKANSKVKRVYLEYNEIITQWYLFQLKNK